MNILLLSSQSPGDAEHIAYTGLFRLFGNKAVDFPCLNALWEKSPLPYGGWLQNEENNVDRNNISEKISQNFFDLIIVSRDAWEEYKAQLSRKEHVCLLDGNAGTPVDAGILQGSGMTLYLKNECPAEEASDRVLPFSLAFEPTDKAVEIQQCKKILVSKGGTHITGYFPDLASEFKSETEAKKDCQRAALAAIVDEERERTPLLFWKALSTGIPLFARRPRDVSSLPKEGSEVFYFDSPDDLRVKLFRFLSKKEELLEIGSKGKAAFLEKHTCAARMKSVIVAYFKSMKQSLMTSNLYHSPANHGTLFDPAFINELVLTDIAEYCGIFRNAESFWRDPEVATEEESDIFNWKNVLRGHRFLLEGDLISASKCYGDTGLVSPTTTLIHGIACFLLGNRFRANIFWWEVHQTCTFPLVQSLIDLYQTPDAHPERVFLLPVVKGKGLEIGCGARKTSTDAIGIDLLGKGDVGEVGVVKGNTSVADYKCSGDNLYLFDDDSMDYVIQRHNLEHYQDPVKAMKEWVRVLKPGGILGFVVPDDEQLDTIKLDESHKHVFTIESMELLVGFFPELDIVHIGAGLKNWSFLTILKKRGGKDFDYPTELHKVETAQVLQLFQMAKIPHTDSHIQQGLLHCYSQSINKEETACGIIDTLLSKGNEQLALELIEKLFRDLKGSRLLKIHCYLSLGKKQLAERVFRVLLDEEKEGYLYHYLAFLIENTALNKAEAWKHLSASLKENPEQIDAIEQFAKLSHDLNNKEECIEFLGTLTEASFSVRTAAMYQKSLLLENIGRRKGALSLLRDLLSQAPEHPGGLRLLQELHSREDRGND